jgi:hydrogenase/urease accessory protein HupE
MVLGDSTVLALLVLGCAGVLAGYASGYVANWALRRRLYSLEFDIATLETKLLSEVKRRAGEASGKARKADQDLLEAALTTKAVRPEPPQPWWMKFAQNPDLREQ